jgi:integrase
MPRPEVPATLPELEAIVKAMPERYRLMVLLGAWCAMRFGELAELRRSDVDVRNGVVHVRRGVIRGDTGRAVKDPKSQVGKRDVNIPPHLLPALCDHLRDHVAASQAAQMFPAAKRCPHGAQHALQRVPPGARRSRAR